MLEHRINTIRNQYISKELWMQSRAAAMLAGKTISEWLKEAIEEKIRKDNKDV